MSAVHLLQSQPGMCFPVIEKVKEQPIIPLISHGLLSNITVSCNNKMQPSCIEDTITREPCKNPATRSHVAITSLVGVKLPEDGNNS